VAGVLKPTNVYLSIGTKCSATQANAAQINGVQQIAVRILILLCILLIPTK
jgi:hypothetical protein